VECEWSCSFDERGRVFKAELDGSFEPVATANPSLGCFDTGGEVLKSKG
jgi:hypothetical protein